jgi:hypothetical protein
VPAGQRIDDLQPMALECQNDYGQRRDERNNEEQGGG